MSFPAGSCAGPDGLRPQHLEDMVNCQEKGPDLLTALTGFTNMVLSASCPREVTPYFFGGRLIALEKKSGDQTHCSRLDFSPPCFQVC